MIRTGVIVVTGSDMVSGERTMSALKRGAFDFIIKSIAKQGEDGVAMLHEALAEKISAFGKTLEKTESARLAAKLAGSGHIATRGSQQIPSPAATDRQATTTRSPSAIGYKALVIGISTGGPEALRKFLPALSGRFPVPICIVQHMTKGFTAHLTRSLDKDCSLSVLEATQFQVIRAGQVVFAPSDFHLEVRKKDKVVSTFLTKAPPENSCRPAVDVLFRSASTAYGDHVLSLVMTGMGHDGLAGVQAIRQAGGYCVIQEGSTCAINGMPKAVAAAGEADEVVPLEQLANRIQTILQLQGRRSA